ncbi:MAG: transposase [Bacteroidales bacterium]|nr:transposase [Bacteroidales bacterium]
MLYIGGVADHVHIFVGMHPAESVADLVKQLKGQSSIWVNRNYLHGKFAWQTGYGAFSYNQSLVPTVKAYVENQRLHHRRKTFQEELTDILRKANIDYDPVYMMKGFVDTEKHR